MEHFSFFFQSTPCHLCRPKFCSNSKISGGSNNNIESFGILFPLRSLPHCIEGATKPAQIEFRLHFRVFQPKGHYDIQDKIQLETNFVFRAYFTYRMRSRCPPPPFFCPASCDPEPGTIHNLQTEFFGPEIDPAHF